MTNLNILADRYAQIKAEADAWAKKLESIKDEIRELGESEIVGLHFTVTVGKSNRTTIDSQLVKELLSEEDIKLVSKTSEITTIRVKASSQMAA